MADQPLTVNMLRAAVRLVGDRMTGYGSDDPIRDAHYACTTDGAPTDEDSVHAVNEIAGRIISTVEQVLRRRDS